MDFKKDYYKILDVNKTASKEDIKSSYRKLVIKYHPDKNQGNIEFEELIKEINEAYSILDDENKKIIYDEYINEKQRQDDNKNIKNKRTYTVKKNVNKNQRFYLKGKIKIKYSGDQDQNLTTNILKETFYHIHISDVEIEIDEKSIISNEITSLSNNDLNYQIFKPELKCPIRTKILRDNEKFDYYDLDIKDIKLISPNIVDVTKIGGTTFGTIVANFIGYILKEKSEIIEEIVTECFGETGEFEVKTDENGVDFVRNEYFHSNCTKYWGPWVKVVKPYSSAKKPFERSNKNYYNGSGCLDSFGYNNNGCYNSSGCLGSFFSIIYWLWILSLIFRFSPIFTLILLFLFLTTFFTKSIGSGIINFGVKLFKYLFSIFIFIFIIGFIYTIFKSFSNTNNNNSTPSTTNSSITETKTKYKTKNNKFNDFLITHEVRWKSLNNDSFKINLSILLSDYNAAKINHNQLPYLLSNESDYTNVYADLYLYDSSKMNRIYKSYDSIILANNLNRLNTSRMIVSSIQSIPYATVLESSCSNSNNINRYPLYTNNSIECVGFEKYGVRSPVEFLKDLKGDCDTRALFLYSILKYFKFDVVILTSSKYQHALIAVNLEKDNPIDGKFLLINNKKYFLWETTSYGWEPGKISNDISNLKYWNLSLFNN